MGDGRPLVRWLDEVGLEDHHLVGGKNASLGELHRALAPLGIRVPGGVAVTTGAFDAHVAQPGLRPALEEALAGLDVADPAALRTAGARAREVVLGTPLPAAVADAVTAAYAKLSRREGAPDVAVRSSATAEDLADASFAGQQESYLNVRGEAAVLDACRRCFASLFTDRALSYRAKRGIDHLGVSLAVGIQPMVRADLGASGVLFTLDPETGFPEVVLVTAVWGLGEGLVQGAVTPDEYLVFKPSLRQGFRALLDRRLGRKDVKVVYADGPEGGVQVVPVPPAHRGRFALGEEEVSILARWGCLIEAHYSARARRPTPMDVEWARDGRTGELVVLQARPETVRSRQRADVVETHRLTARGPVLARGRSVGDRVGAGPVQVIRDARDLASFRPGSVLVTERTDPDWEPAMRCAAAIVTDRGGRTCHAAIVSRELGLPAVVGTGDGTAHLADGRAVTVSCAEGPDGVVYDGTLPVEVQTVDLSRLERPRTHVMLNVGNPADAMGLAALPQDGVGLARLEFLIFLIASIGIHPMALVRYPALPDPAVRDAIARATEGYADKPEFFVDRLARGVATIAAAFYPKDVIVRLSDFKTNEYANLVGGRLFEPVEANPMLGFRGAVRYDDPRYREGFALECRALARVRDELGLANVKVMVPFCRTPAEGRRVLDAMARHGLVQGERGLEVYVMCEVPSNVILAEAFAELFDGFSIGSNDLTQLTLGVDRDSEVLAAAFDERDPAVRALIQRVIRVAHAHGRKVGLCGQGPSDYPDFAAFLVRQGIDSISLTPDALIRTTRAIVEAERALPRRAARPARLAVRPGARVVRRTLHGEAGGGAVAAT
jgi:pyruvate,water dikinase